ncbi:substrate-binding domain-containing protein [Leucobacter ruminantium]|uniref:Substrate-binding domain-containing protein n=1 Tax=Leucobacter ruminantium TaxID=1289170 RepID=A0A939LUK1_9MICO|nr:substrate-binding domain-containing protein [Leucobacter ruminantium]MBO1805054.1 substrate-binding domain-containing protein [Leucobacter ruminantium]
MKKFTRIAAGVAVAGMALFGLTACGSTEDGGGDGATGEARNVEDLKIGFLIRQLDAPYFAAMQKEAEDLAEEHGFELLVQDAGGDAVKQLDQANTMVTQGVDVLLINATSQDTQRDQLEQLAGEVPIVFVDYGIPDVGVTTVQSANEEIGRLSGKLTGERLGKGTEISVGVLTGPPEDDIVGPQRQGGFLKGLEEAGVKYEVVAETPAGWATDQAVPATESILAANPDLGLLLGLNDSMALGGLTVLEDQGNTTTLVAAASDGQKEALKLIKDQGCEGRYISTGLNSPSLAVNRAMEIAIQIGTGEAAADSFEPLEFTEAAGINCENVDDYYDPDSVF